MDDDKELEVVETEAEAEESKEEVKSERTEKPQESPEARRARMQRQYARLGKQLGIENPKAEVKKSDEFDEGQLAYLATRGIESDADLDFTKKEMKKSNSTLTELLKNEYFQNKLKVRREAEKALEAIPDPKRSNLAQNDSVEYHTAKYFQTGKLPSDPEMREKVVNARIKKETQTNQFTDTPVIGNY